MCDAPRPDSGRLDISHHYDAGIPCRIHQAVIELIDDIQEFRLIRQDFRQAGTVKKVFTEEDGLITSLETGLSD